MALNRAPAVPAPALVRAAVEAVAEQVAEAEQVVVEAELEVEAVTVRLEVAWTHSRRFHWCLRHHQQAQ